MRNRYPGDCYRCGGIVAAGAGHFERFNGGWRVQHADCAIVHRGTPDPARQAERERWAASQDEWTKIMASGTGKRAQRARRRLRDQQREESV